MRVMSTFFLLFCREVSFTNERSSAGSGRKDKLFGGRSLQDEASSGRDRSVETKSGTNEKDGAGWYNPGRGDDGRNTGVQGNSDMPLLQGEEEGRCTVEVLSRILLRLS